MSIYFKDLFFEKGEKVMDKCYLLWKRSYLFKWLPRPTHKYVLIYSPTAEAHDAEAAHILERYV